MNDLAPLVQDAQAAFEQARAPAELENAKAHYLGLQLSEAEIALMARLKHAFDPHGVLNPGKMWETTAADLQGLSAEPADR